MSATIARFSSSVVRSASRTCRTSDLATRQTTGVSRVEQRAHLRVVLDADAGLAGGAERDQLGVPQLQLGAGAGEELGVLGQRARPAALDEADADLVQQPGDGQLVGDGVADALALGAVAQGGVEDVEVGGGGHGMLPVVDYRPEHEKDPPGTGGLRAVGEVTAR